MKFLPLSKFLESSTLVKNLGACYAADDLAIEEHEDGPGYIFSDPDGRPVGWMRDYDYRTGGFSTLIGNMEPVGCYQDIAAEVWLHCRTEGLIR